MRIKKLIVFLGMFAGVLAASANPVVVKMNSTSQTMTLSEYPEGKPVELPEPGNYLYEMNLTPGKYLLTGFDKNRNNNGSIVINVTDSTTVQQITVLTCTAWATNKHEDSSAWTSENGDYRFEVDVFTKEGVKQEVTPGVSSTAGRHTFLALNGNSYYASFIPSETHEQEGYMTLYRGGTLTAGVNISGAIPTGGEFGITVPNGAGLELGLKFTHFTDFSYIKPIAREAVDGGERYTYRLANNQIYNYRAWKEGGLTHAGYFTMNVDPSQAPEIIFTESDFTKKDPKAYNHDVMSNNGYETGDLFLNIDETGQLKLKKDQEFLLHAMRTWEATDNATNNYFMEPDFHFTILDLEGNPCNSVIEISNPTDHYSAWRTVKGIGKGTVMVLVTYDGMNLNYYNKTNKSEYFGGEYWGAIWPENTGVFIVSVDEPESQAKPNMVINQQYNVGTLRLAGENADAEHDVFYYLDEEEGFPFSFRPENAETVTLCRPVINDGFVSYKGFTSDNVTTNEDGGYTLLLTEGRNIVRLTDSEGNSTYQVLRAKPCHREIINTNRPDSKIFQPGDKVKIQYSGLFHPANKIAGIYNMSAYITYNGVPNGSSLILGAGQYTFGSAPSAQAVTLDIPADHDVATTPVLIMDEGVIQVNGYGDPIGNHRNTSPVAGRSPNFTAVPHQTYFGALPPVTIKLQEIKNFDIKLLTNTEDPEVTVTFNGEELVPEESGLYKGTYGTYSVTAAKEGYRCYRGEFNIDDYADGLQVFEFEMEAGEGIWDGKSVAEPEQDEDGVYLIFSPEELASVAPKVNEGKTMKLKIMNDIDLGDYEWTAIGTSSKPFTGSIDGNDNTVSGLYIDKPNDNYQGLFGYCKGTADSPVVISNLTVDGTVNAKQYSAGLVGYTHNYTDIDRCANYALINGTSYIGGITGYLQANCNVTNVYNAGDITASSNSAGVIGYNNASAVMKNMHNSGLVVTNTPKSTGSVVGGTTKKTNLENAYYSYPAGDITEGQTLVSEEQMVSGEIAYLLGDAFNQTIGEDPFPVFNGHKVYFDSDSEEYYNKATGFLIDPGLGNENVTVVDGVVTMHAEDTYSLQIVTTPKGARIGDVSWHSEDDEIASVDSEGVVTARKKGDTVITATAMVEGKEITEAVKIVVTDLTTSVESIFDMNALDRFDIYDINGRTVRLDADVEFTKTLAPGLYVFKTESITKVVIVK